MEPVHKAKGGLQCMFGFVCLVWRFFWGGAGRVRRVLLCMSLMRNKDGSLMLKTFPSFYNPFVVTLHQSPFLADLMPIVLSFLQETAKRYMKNTLFFKND